MTAVLSWMFFGLVVGLVARLLMPGSGPRGMLVTISLGMAGAVVGGALGRGLGLYGPGQTAGFLMSLVGAAAVLALYRALAGRP
jgi:uncharacterized membrane protein YeaQ/YmgE (transglycosylase-associated protein family)